MSRLSPIFLLAGLAACSADVADEHDWVDEANSDIRATGVVEARLQLDVEREQSPSTEVVSTARATARFVRLGTDIDTDLVDRVVGRSRHRPGVSVRGCTVETSGQRDHESRTVDGVGKLLRLERSAIEFVDVGEVTLVADQSRYPLAPRAFPTVAEFVSGVVYTSRDDSRPLSRASSLRFEASGSAAMRPLVVSIGTLPSLDEVRLVDAAGVDLEGTFLRGASLHLRWQSDRQADGSVTIVVEEEAEDAESRVRCTFADHGQATIPADALRGLSSDELRMTVGRHRRKVHSVRPTERVIVDVDELVRLRARVTDRL